MTNLTRALLLKAAKTAEATWATNDAAKAVASAAANASTPQLPASSHPSSTPPQYILLHHHKEPSLLQSRHPGSFSYLAHHISSAIDASISLCMYQEARDRFLSLTTAPSEGDTIRSEDDGGLMGSIINSRVLGQSDMGFLKPLTLFHELGDPIFQQNPKFNIYEVLDGCGWALEQFHRTKEELLPKLMKHVDATREVSDNGVENHEDSGNKVVNGDIPSELNYNFLDVAAKNPDSVESSFVAMTTPEALDVIKLDGIMRLLLGHTVGSDDASIPPLATAQTVDDVNKLKEYYGTGGLVINEDTKVMNVALLSARVDEIYPPPPSAEQTLLLQKKDDDPDAPLEDDSLMPLRQSTNSEEDESKAQVITQLEVLYELQQSSINDEGKTRTQTSVMVGKFEGCLDGDPNGDELRWKLASYRPAVEFYNTF